MSNSVSYFILFLSRWTQPQLSELFIFKHTCFPRAFHWIFCTLCSKMFYFPGSNLFNIYFRYLIHSAAPLIVLIPTKFVYKPILAYEKTFEDKHNHFILIDMKAPRHFARAPTIIRRQQRPRQISRITHTAPGGFLLLSRP